MAEARLVHASCVACRGRAILIIGPSGSGKSDLALRLIDRGARLVSDDQTLVKTAEGRLLASPPATIEGKVEVRGLGILAMQWETDVPVALAIELGCAVERFPLHPHNLDLLGHAVPLIRLNGLEASAPVKVELALAGLAL